MRQAGEIGGADLLTSPFANVKVVDLSSYIAGALCPGLLADFGASVIKVESLAGDPFRSLGPTFQDWNRGKRSICVDLKSEEGRGVLYRLVKEADVVVENYRPGVARRLGADYETLSKINPSLVYCSVSAYGQEGPYRSKPGFDPLLQARSGAMAFQGGASRPPVFLVLAISDYGAACLGAYGVSLGLLARARTGKGRKVETSLLRACMAMQSGRYVVVRRGENGCREADYVGEGPGYRIYETSDGWIFLGVRSGNEWERLSRVIGESTLPASNGASSDEAAAQVLTKTFASASTGEWLAKLEREHVPCSPVQHVSDLYDDTQMKRNGLSVDYESPDLGPITLRGAPAIFSKTPGVSEKAAPALGQHTDEVLEEAGYSGEEISTLRSCKAVR